MQTHEEKYNFYRGNGLADWIENYVNELKTLLNISNQNNVCDTEIIHDLKTEIAELKKLNAKYYDELRELVLMTRKICYCGCGAPECSETCDPKIEFDILMYKYKEIIWKNT